MPKASAIQGENMAASAACLFTYLDVNRLTDTTDLTGTLFFLNLFSGK